MYLICNKASVIEKKLNSFNQQEQEVAVISVVVPMDVSDTSSNEANANIATLSAINGNADLAQQMANGQLTVLQTQTADGEEAVPQYITVTGKSNTLFSITVIYTKTDKHILKDNL